MNAKLTPGICYVAGLFSKSREDEKSAVGIRTSVPEIEQRFLEIAIKELLIEPNKVIIEESESGSRHIYFYHSRVAKLLKDISAREVHIFKKKDAMSANYAAGMFDAGGHVRPTTLSMSPLSASDAFMFENLGIHTKGNLILNISSFMALVKGLSVILSNNKISR
jgi:hypothetical protein